MFTLENHVMECNQMVSIQGITLRHTIFTVAVHTRIVVAASCSSVGTGHLVKIHERTDEGKYILKELSKKYILQKKEVWAEQ